MVRLKIGRGASSYKRNDFIYFEIPPLYRISSYIPHAQLGALSFSFLQLYLLACQDDIKI
jgi:hypothetical protein